MRKLILVLSVALFSATALYAQDDIESAFFQLNWEIQRQNEILQRAEREAERARECQRCVNNTLAMGLDYQTALAFCSECR
jgi:hypothetical protein